MPRRLQAQQYRTDLATLAAARSHPDHVANEDERASLDYALSFTKGLPHRADTGLITSHADYDLFVRAIDSGDPADFIATPLGPPGGTFTPSTVTGSLRAWESQGAGSAFDLQGPDAQAVTMPPAPSLGSAELVAEMAEVYGHALLRDLPLSRFRVGAGDDADINDMLGVLSSLTWFSTDPVIGVVTLEAARRRRTNLTQGNLFRGIAPGDNVGPYVSQFLLIGSAGLDQANPRPVTDGLIDYGAQTISQKVPRAESVDFMTDWNDWLNVQNALAPEREPYVANTDVFITTGRDLATYVHYDALYQAYLNACLILLSRDRQELPFDPGIPFQLDNAVDHQQGFAHFGGPHILSLVTEVATRALKAVRFQKFNVHRRLRPEALAARVHQAPNLDVGGDEFMKLRDSLEDSGILDRVSEHNPSDSLLLPMAFPEGSPMHPSYGAGHATVAGACVTVLKAFFDHSQPFAANGTDASRAYVASDDGSTLEEVDVFGLYGNSAQLTVEGELNKLAANISIGRDWAGVHYFTDYWESLLLGERIAIQILEEQRAAFPENFSMTVPLFSGGTRRI